MELRELTLLTIITERILRDEILDLIMDSDATGYTLTDATGEGSRGVRASEWEGKSVKVEVICEQEIADTILKEVKDRYFENYSVIGYLQEVKVVRGSKYSSEE